MITQGMFISGISKTSRLVCGVIFYLLATLSQVIADDAINNKVNINFHGTLRHYPCHINSDKEIDVHFGKIGVNKINGENYLQHIDYTIVCDGNDTVDSLMLSVTGAVSTFDSAALQTNIQDLAIKMYENGKALEINKPIAIDLDNRPDLTVVPVKRTDVTLATGDFNVIATLMVNYQ